MTPRILSAALLATASLVLATPTFAASIASDNASNPVYLDGWNTGDNGGSGFGAWALTGSANSGFFDFTSTENGDANHDGDIDSTGGKAWGLYANAGDSNNPVPSTASAYRPFTCALAVGQTFSLDIDNGLIDSGNRVGFALTNASGQSRFEFYFRGGRSFYTFSDLAGSEQSAGSVAFTTEGLHVTFTVLANDHYTSTITPRDGSPGYTFLGGLAGNAFTGITGVTLFNENAGHNADHNAYFNNLSIGAVPVPLPAAAIGALPLLGLLGIGRARRKQ